MMNGNSTFAKHQCGVGNRIAIADLRTNVSGHEYASTVRSHYAQYKTALTSNNPGAYYESAVAPPGTDGGRVQHDYRYGDPESAERS